MGASQGAVTGDFSIHALLAESDRLWSLRSMIEMFFYPRSPCGERRVEEVSGDTWMRVFYPRSPCGERLAPPYNLMIHQKFSIHALLAESDRVQRGQFSRIRLFYPRSPCGERPLSFASCLTALFFLSTLSLRRATLHAWRNV